MSETITVGDQIRYARKNAELTQKELGDRLGVSASMIGQYETGVRRPKYQTLRKISAALGVDLRCFIESEGSQIIMAGIKNENIRDTAKQYGVRLWEIADRLHITDTTFSKRLRRELPESEQQKIIGIIKTIWEERVNG